MKKFYLVPLLFAGTLAFGQNAPIDFEEGGIGADWTWATFEAPEGENNPTFSVVPNVLVDGTNPSATVAKIEIEYATAATWGCAGCESQHNADLGAFSFTTENSSVSLMFYQEGFAAPVALKFATPSGAAWPEVVVQNDIADAWVDVTFDVSAWIGNPLGGQPDQIIFFPSYGPRESGHTVYFDNVSFGPVGPGPLDPLNPAPDPTIDEDLVISAYSDYYLSNTVESFNFNAFQGGGNVSEIQIEGNNTGKVQGLTYYGADWTNADITEFDSVHFDYWARNASVFNFYVINVSNGIPGGSAEEPRYSIAASGGDEALIQEEWVHVSIPLQHFLDYPTGSYTYTLDAVNQYKFDGNGDLYFDNIFFSKVGSVGLSTLPESAFEAYPNPSKDFWIISSKRADIVRVEVYNILGQEVATFTPNSQQIRLDASAFNIGLYFVRATTPEGMRTLKLMKE